MNFAKNQSVLELPHNLIGSCVLYTSSDMLTTDRNDIVDDWTEVCKLGRPEFLSADCSDFDQVYCTCCTVCCEESNPECNDEIVLANLDARWENDFSRTAYDFGPNSVFENDEAVEDDEYDEYDDGGGSER